MLQTTHLHLRDSSSNKKHSRRIACDLCRAKKRRCDWQEATATCSVCRRNNVLCVFDYVRKAQRTKCQIQNHTPSEQTLEAFKGHFDSHRHSDEAGLPKSTVDNSAVSTSTISDKTTGSSFLLFSDHIAHNSSSYAPDAHMQRSKALPIHVQWQGSFGEPATATGQGFQLNWQIWPEKQAPRAFDLALPPSSECSFEELWILVQEFLEDFNRAIPLFDEMWVTDTFRRYQAGEGISTTSLLCLQVILAIAHRLRAQSPISTYADHLQASKYLRYVCSQVGDLLLQRPSLVQAQCMMGLGVLLQGTGSPERACGPISTALRILDQLNKITLPVRKIRKLEFEPQARLVWWIGLFMDASICLRKALPPTINLETAEIDLLHLKFLLNDNINQQGVIRSVDGKTERNILQAHAELALIQMRLLRTLSPDSESKDLSQDGDSVVQALETQFGIWRAYFSCPMDSGGIYATFHRSDIVHIGILEAKAFETICAIYGISKARLLIMMRSQLSEDVQKLVDKTIVIESKRFLQLFALIPHGDIACNRLNSEAYVLASLILFLSIVQFPLCPQARLKHGLAQSTILRIKSFDEAGDVQALSPSLRACLWLGILAEKLLDGDISRSAALHALGNF